MAAQPNVDEVGEVEQQCDYIYRIDARKACEPEIPPVHCWLALQIHDRENVAGEDEEKIHGDVAQRHELADVRGACGEQRDHPPAVLQHNIKCCEEADGG